MGGHVRTKPGATYPVTLIDPLLLNKIDINAPRPVVISVQTTSNICIVFPGFAGLNVETLFSLKNAKIGRGVSEGGPVEVSFILLVDNFTLGSTCTASQTKIITRLLVMLPVTLTKVPYEDEEDLSKNEMQPSAENATRAVSKIGSELDIFF
jgi:hypothetical protein